VERGEKAAAEIRTQTGGEVIVEQMDLGEKIAKDSDQLLFWKLNLTSFIN